MNSPLFNAPAPKAAKPAPAPAEALDLDLAQIPEARLELMPRANGTARFQPLLARLPDAEAQAQSLVIRDTDTPEEAANKSTMARRLRLDGFRATRLEAAKIHKELKAGILEIGRELDGAERTLRQRCEKWEAELEEIETYAERMEQQRRADLRNARSLEINPFLTGALAVDLADLSAEEYAAALADAKELHELREARAKAAEEARVKAEQEAEQRRKAEAEAAAAERARLEQERLREQIHWQEQAAKLEKERQAAAEERAKAAAERARQEKRAAEERARLESEAAAERARLAEEARKIAIERDRVAAAARAAKAKADAEAAAEARRVEQEAEAARRAAAAPDAEKVKALRQRLIDMPLPRTDNNKVFQACDRAVKLATDELARIIAKLEGGAQ